MHRLGLALLLIPGFAGCGDGTGPDTGSLKLEAAQAVTVRIGSAGGALRTVDSRGRVYRLNIPPLALRDSTDITLTPVARYDLPAGATLVAAAQFAPEGLQLAAATATRSSSRCATSAAPAWPRHRTSRSSRRRCPPGRPSRCTSTSRISRGRGARPDLAAATTDQALLNAIARYDDWLSVLDCGGSTCAETGGVGLFLWPDDVRIAILSLVVSVSPDVRLALARALKAGIDRLNTQCTTGHDLQAAYNTLYLDGLALANRVETLVPATSSPSWCTTPRMNVPTATSRSRRARRSSTAAPRRSSPLPSPV